jgi:hypothetical protein
MSIFLGFDRSEYPGNNVMQLLRDKAQIAFTGFYLAPAPSHGDDGWMDRREFLADLGFGFAPIYVGRQQSGPGSHVLSEGTNDGANAAELASQAGFPEASVLYLDIESGPPAHQPLLDYYKAWVQSVIDNGFSPGVYCSHLLGARFMETDDRAVPWVFQLKSATPQTFTPPLSAPDPSHSSFGFAKVLQYAQNGTLVLGSTKLNPVDLDTALMADPSVPQFAEEEGSST